MPKAKSTSPYRDAEVGVDGEHPIDAAVHARVPQTVVCRELAELSMKILATLGLKKRLWHRYESLTSKRQGALHAAYYDLGYIEGMAMGSRHEPNALGRALAERAIRSAASTPTEAAIAAADVFVRVAHAHR